MRRVPGARQPAPRHLLQDRPPNVRDEAGRLFLVRCYVCDPIHGRENYILMVSTGTCAWCGWAWRDVDKPPSGRPS